MTCRRPLGQAGMDALEGLDLDPAVACTRGHVRGVRLHRTGHAIPSALVDRDWSEPHVPNEALVTVFKKIYEHPHEHWNAYEMAEKLIDVEERFQVWRFRHLSTVKRIIGHKMGTGGSSGVGFLQKALALCFFPELWDVRTRLEAPSD